MSHLLTRLRQWDERMFIVINNDWHTLWLHRILEKLTHCGGFFATVSVPIGMMFFASSSFVVVPMHCLLSVILSHIPVWILKKTYRRIRPYFVFPQAVTGTVKFCDHSFPSGHTTAIYALVTPFMAYGGFAIWTSMLGLLGILVGFSRIYLGQHYPSDVLAGGVIGGVTAGLVITFVPFPFY